MANRNADKPERVKRPRSSREKKDLRVKVGKLVAVVAVLALCVLLAVFVGDADYRATVSGWLPLLVVVALIALAFAYLQVVKRRFTFGEVSNVTDCVRGQDVDYLVNFRNDSPLFMFRIDAVFYISDLFGGNASESSTTLSLKPRESYDLGFKARFDHIGTYSAGVDRVMICDYLRLFTHTEVSERRSKVQVTPHIQPMSGIHFTNAALVENKRALRATLADSIDYAYVRDYVPGDPIKNIHWKISARSQGYMTRLYEVYTNPGVAVILDFYAPESRSNMLMGLFDCIVETAFSVARFAQLQGMDTEIHYMDRLGDHKTRMHWEERDLPEIVDEMPRIGNDDRFQAEGLRLIREQSYAQYGQNNVVICTADLSAEMISTVIELRMRRRDPILFAVVPNDLVGREREDWCADLARLDAVNIGYVVLSRSEELLEVGE